VNVFSSKKSSLVCAVALSSALALAGCGSSTATAPATAPVTSAGDSTPAVSTPAVAAADKVIDGTTLVSKMTDAMMKAGSGTMTMSTTGGGATAGAGAMNTVSKFAVSGTTINVQATMGIAGQQMEIISVDGVGYIKSSLFASSGKPWVKLDPNATDAFSKQMASSMKQSSDVRAALEIYKGSTATLVDSSGGLRHYKLTNVMVTVSPTVAPINQTVDLWLDDQDRPAKSTVVTSGITVEVKYSDWGAPVTITAPPADQVGTLKMPGA
jgi:hypothetical protein